MKILYQFSITVLDPIIQLSGPEECLLYTQPSVSIICDGAERESDYRYKSIEFGGSDVDIVGADSEC